MVEKEKQKKNKIIRNKTNKKQKGVNQKKAIVLCSNKGYLEKAERTINEIRIKGEWNGDIVFFHDKELHDDTKLKGMKEKYDLILKEFPTLDTSKVEKLYNSSDKIFQFFKFNLFDTYFKKWDTILYIDAGMHIFKPLNRLFNIDVKGYLFANSDAKPTYEWTLESQFNIDKDKDITNELKKEFDLTKKDYFQSTMMLFDTSIIHNNTVKELVELMNKYPICFGTKDQAILNLYFLNKRNLWKPLPLNDNEGLLYDFNERENKKEDYIMVKYPKQKGGNIHYNCIILIIDHSHILTNTETNEYKRIMNFKNIWKKYMNNYNDILSLFICADEKLNDGEYKLDLTNNTLYTYGKECITPCGTQKTLRSMKYILDNYSFDYVLRTNLSSFYVLSKFKDSLDLLSKTKLFKGKSGETFISGTQMIFSNDIIKMLVNDMNIIMNSCNSNRKDGLHNDDVCISHYLKKNNIVLQPSDSVYEFIDKSTNIGDNNNIDGTNLDIEISNKLYDYYYNNGMKGGEKKRVIHKIVNKTKSGIYPKGLGDFIKGTISLYLLSKELNYELLVDFSDHPINKYINITYSDNINDINEYLDKSYDELKSFVNDKLQNNDSIYIITNVNNDSELDNNDRNNLQNFFKPNDKLNNYINTLKNDIQLSNIYSCIHIRSGDYEILNNKLNNKYRPNTYSSPILDDSLINEIEKTIILLNIDTKNDILCISDSKRVVEYFSNKYNYKRTNSNPIHFGGLSTNTSEIDLAILSTLSDFFIMKDSTKIYSISVHSWNSGFSSMVARLFNVPIEKKVVENVKRMG